jgi:nucleoside permease NupC
MKTLLSFVMMPLVFLMGVPWEDCKIVGEVVGLKTVVNEFVGYTRLSNLVHTTHFWNNLHRFIGYAHSQRDWKS